MPESAVNTMPTSKINIYGAFVGVHRRGQGLFTKSCGGVILAVGVGLDGSSGRQWPR